MKIGPIGFWELLVIAVLVLLLFGPQKLPEMARGLSQALREFRRGLNEVSREFQEELTEAADATAAAAEAERTATAPPPAPVEAEQAVQPGGPPAINAPVEETHSR